MYAYRTEMPVNINLKYDFSSTFHCISTQVTVFLEGLRKILFYQFIHSIQMTGEKDNDHESGINLHI